MKRISIFLLLALSTLLVNAQTEPTVSATKINVRYCETTTSTLTKSVGLGAFPLTWYGVNFSEYGTKVTTMLNARGCDSIVTLTVNPIPGACPYEFSVSANKKVYFSQGNLQYRYKDEDNVLKHQTMNGERDGEWRFAEHQYDLIGNVSTNYNPSTSSTAWTDYFNWGTSGYDVQPYQATTYYTGITEPMDSVYDWGYFNAISNGGNQPRMWRTLRTSEWYYIFYQRENHTALWWVRTIEGFHKGILLFPDKWNGPAGADIPQTISLEQWIELESLGAVFLPFSGYRSGKSSISSIDASADMWTFTNGTSSNSTAPYFSLQTSEPQISSSGNRGNGKAVRLVIDAQ